MANKRLKIPPTPSALLTLKRKIAFLEPGYPRLERNQELLTRLEAEERNTLFQIKILREQRHSMS